MKNLYSVFIHSVLDYMQWTDKQTKDRGDTYASFPDLYAFALWQCRHPDFHLIN
jgi:hypothetical protein